MMPIRSKEKVGLNQVANMKAHDVVDAIFESGVFKPAEPVALEEGQKVRLSIEPLNGAPAGVAREELRRWTEVFEGLSDDDVLECV